MLDWKTPSVKLYINSDECECLATALVKGVLRLSIPNRGVMKEVPRRMIAFSPVRRFAIIEASDIGALFCSAKSSCELRIIPRGDRGWNAGAFRQAHGRAKVTSLLNTAVATF